MPKLYDYFGLRVYFDANEHEPIHVHGFHQGRESKAELIIVNGEIVRIRFVEVDGMRPLTGPALADFKTLVAHRAGDIVAKWVDFFVHHRPIQAERITRRLK